MLDRLYAGRMRQPLLRPDGAGDGLHNPAPETAEQIEEAATDVTAAFNRFASALEKLGPHFEKLVSEGIRLHPIEAAKQVPEAAGEVVSGGAEAGGQAIQAGGHVVGTVPAAATDVLDTTGAATTGVKRAAKYTLKKRK